MQEVRQRFAFGRPFLVWCKGLALCSLSQSCTGKERTSLQEKQARCIAREDLSFCIQPRGRFRAMSKRLYRMEKVTTLSCTVFFPTLSELMLFCINISSFKHLLQVGSVHVLPQTKSLLLHLVNTLCCLVQRRTGFDANTFIDMYKKPMFLLAPERQCGRTAREQALQFQNASGTCVVITPQTLCVILSVMAP